MFWRLRKDMELGEGSTPQAPGREETSLNLKRGRHYKRSTTKLYFLTKHKHHSL